MLNAQQTVAQVVLDHSECAEVFKRHRIDYCCKGHVPVAEAATSRGMDVDALMADLESAVQARAAPAVDDPRALSTPDLVKRIVTRHHGYLRRALPFLQGLSAKVARVHGDHNPRLRDLDAAVQELIHALQPHLDEEEQHLFPLLDLSDAASVSARRTALAAMVMEHLQVADLLERIHEASEAFTLPDWACTSYRTLFAELRRLEGDIYEHVHLENHVLLPRFST